MNFASYQLDPELIPTMSVAIPYERYVPQRLMEIPKRASFAKKNQNSNVKSLPHVLFRFKQISKPQIE